MAVSGTKLNIDLNSIQYFSDKTEKTQTANATVNALSPEDLKKFTTYVDTVIQKLIPDDAKEKLNGQSKELVEDIAKNILIARSVMLEDGVLSMQESSVELAEAKKETYKTVIASVAEESIKLINAKFSDVKLVNNAAATLTQDLKEVVAGSQQTVIPDELRKPPKSSLEANTGVPNPETNSSTVTENLLINTRNFIEDISKIKPLESLLKNEAGLKVLSERITQINISQVSAKNTLSEVTEETAKKIKDEIVPQIADATKFEEAVSKLNDSEKVVLAATLLSVKGSVESKIENENMAKSVTEIKQEIGPGTKLFKELIKGIADLINTSPSSTTQASAEAGIPESAKINKLLEEFKEALKEAKSNSIPAERVKARAEAKENFFEKLKVSYEASEISKEGLEVLVKALKSDDPQAAINNSQKESASKFLKDLNISADDLKQWGSMAAMVAVGLMIFCPRAITGVVQAGTGLAGMAANTLPMILQAQTMLQVSKVSQNNAAVAA